MREVPFIFFAAVLLAAVVLAAGCFYGWRRNRKMYRTIDRMLDEILDGEPISQSDIREGEISVLASKAKRVKGPPRQSGSKRKWIWGSAQRRKKRSR